MKKLLLSCLAIFAASTAMADSTSWLHFAESAGGTHVESVQFKNGGKLTFDDSGMTYSDNEQEKTIPHTATYLYFSDSKVTDIESIAAEAAQQEEAWLTFSPETQQIMVSGMEEASQIRLISLQGTLLRAVCNASAITTADMPPSIVIATAVRNGKTVSKKFIIR